MNETEAPARLPAARSELTDIARMGMWLAAAESEAQNPEALGASAALRLAFARELGLPLTAAAELHVIKGRLTLGALLLRALAERRGYRIEKVDAGDEACTAVVYNGDDRELGRATYTIERAKRAGLVKDRGGWVKNPDRMLWARAATEAIRDFAPEVAVGLLVTEELDEVEGAVGEYEPPAVYEPTTDFTERAQDEQDWQEAQAAGEPETEPAGPGPWTDKQRRTIFAIVGELDRSFPPPVVEGEQTPDWRDVVDRSARHHYNKELRQLTRPEADDLIVKMRARLKTLQAERPEPEPEPETDQNPTNSDDDIPF